MSNNISFFSSTLLTHFGITDPIAKETVLDNGHINGTYRIDLLGDEGIYSVILQSVNTYVFKDPVSIMRNIDLVTDHIRGKLLKEGKDPARRVMKLYKTSHGTNYFLDKEGRYWRSYPYISGARTFDWADNPDLLYKTGSAFGAFQRYLSDFPMDLLTETIPNFHNTPLRMQQLEEAILQDPHGRAAEVQEEIQFFRDRAVIAGKLVDMQKQGILPYTRDP
ncbi:MAG TPA: hypothetical protein DCY75_05370 [Clostridiales bacterium]|nr:hypothetical protein [Clostridiales bacterium]